MKVYIGPFPDYNAEPDAWRPGEVLNREINVTIDDYDCVDLLSTLAYIIHPALLRMKEYKQSFPCQCENPAENIEECTCDEKWNEILDKMIWSFAHILDDSDEDQFYSGEIDSVLIPVDDNGNEVPEDQAVFWRSTKGPNDTFKIDYEGLEQYNNRIQEGLDLFGKWYRHLWT